MTRTWLELHDSTVKEIRHEASRLTIKLHGYVHRWDFAAGAWKGTGWMQPVSLRIGAESTIAIAVPAPISGGWLQISDVRYDLIPLPIESPAPARLLLELADGTELQLAGDGVTLIASGEASYVEDLPADMRPS